VRKILIKDIMTRDVITLNIDESFCRVAEIFQEKNIRHLPIVNAQGEILGIISQHDLNRIASPKRGEHGDYLYDSSLLCTYILQQHLIKDTITLSPEDALEKAVELMARKKLGCIPIVGSEGRVVGIVTPVDMMNLFLKDLRQAR